MTNLAAPAGCTCSYDALLTKAQALEQIAKCPAHRTSTQPKRPDLQPSPTTEGSVAAPARSSE
jgi:hypothetical protein